VIHKKTYAASVAFTMALLMYWVKAPWESGFCAAIGVIGLLEACMEGVRR
jgi:hypothetical protein